MPCRLTQLVRGPGTLTSNFVYYLWNETALLDGQPVGQGGRLKQVTTTGGLQDLRYLYDATGNVRQIEDYAAGGTQTQSFGYDALHRLTSAQASGGTGGIYGPEAYTYDPTTGNLASKAGVTYSYAAQGAGCHSGALSKAHAVTSAGMNEYCYDAITKER